MAARKKRKHDTSASDVEMDMTPMIDIVFQMVMFFVIVSDFSQKDIAKLTLPWSTVGVDDEGDDESRLIINITAPRLSDTKVKKGDENVYSKIMVRGKPHDFQSLQKFLELNGVQNPKYRETDPTKKGLSNRSLLIRCDGNQSFDYVKAILQICAQPDIAIYKVEIATAEQPKDKKKAPTN